MAETLVEKHMRLLGISEVEAIALIESDKKVDKMSQKELTSDLTDEQKKNVKKATQTGTRKTPTVYKFDTTEKKRKEKEVVYYVFHKYERWGKSYGCASDCQRSC